MLPSVTCSSNLTTFCTRHNKDCNFLTRTSACYTTHTRGPWVRVRIHIGRMWSGVLFNKGCFEEKSFSFFLILESETPLLCFLWLRWGMHLYTCLHMFTRWHYSSDKFQHCRQSCAARVLFCFNVKWNLWEALGEKESALMWNETPRNWGRGVQPYI